MMASTITPVTLDYMQRASELLATTAPTVSAALQTSRRTFANASGNPASEGLSSCKACVHVLTTGWRGVSKRPRARQERLAKSTTPKRLSSECTKCGQVNVMEIAKSVKARSGVSRNQQKPQPSVAAPKTEAASKPTQLRDEPSAPASQPSTKSTGKKRNRNKKSSLKSLLADKKPASPSKGGFGLDLMDFMKT